MMLWYRMHEHDSTSNDRSLPSGRFNLRITPELHASLRAAAHAAGVSLNRYCARRLSPPEASLDPAAVVVVQRATSVLGDSLLGVVVFGSWARGDESPDSDLDVLVVADRCVPIARELYRCWDDRPALHWDDHEVTPHFVHLPSGSEGVSGLWAEVALDGLVLFERELTVSRHLAHVRRRILRGELSVRVAGGQSYWVHEP